MKTASQPPTSQKQKQVEILAKKSSSTSAFTQTFLAAAAFVIVGDYEAVRIRQTAWKYIFLSSARAIFTR